MSPVSDDAPVASVVISLADSVVVTSGTLLVLVVVTAVASSGVSVLDALD